MKAEMAGCADDLPAANSVVKKKAAEGATTRSAHKALQTGEAVGSTAQAIALANHHGWTLAVMFLDLDRVKWVNDTHEHAVGDAVLKEMARRRLKHVRHEDTVCRNGGNEFLHLLMDPGVRANLERMAGLMLACIAQPIEVDHLRLIVKPGISISVFPEDGRSEAGLINSADAAMYRAKSSMRASRCSTRSRPIQASTERERLKIRRRRNALDVGTRGSRS